MDGWCGADVWSAVAKPRRGADTALDWSRRTRQTGPFGFADPKRRRRSKTRSAGALQMPASGVRLWQDVSALWNGALGVVSGIECGVIGALFID
jgi:hypothetical protein